MVTKTRCHRPRGGDPVIENDDSWVERCLELTSVTGWFGALRIGVLRVDLVRLGVVRLDSNWMQKLRYTHHLAKTFAETAENSTRMGE